MSRRLLSIGALVAVAGLLCACTGKTPENESTQSPGNPPVSSPASSAVPSGLPYAGAPKVANPLPAMVLSGSPCADALTAEQIDTLLGAPIKATPTDNPQVGIGCSWSNQERGSQILVSYDTKTHTGLSSVYQNTKPQSGVWKPLADIGGFPAVAHAGQPGQTPKDFCVVTVGLADDAAIDITVFLGPSKVGSVDPCDISGQAAEAAVTTLKAKAGV